MLDDIEHRDGVIALIREGPIHVCIVLENGRSAVESGRVDRLTREVETRRVDSEVCQSREKLPDSTPHVKHRAASNPRDVLREVRNIPRTSFVERVGTGAEKIGCRDASSRKRYDLQRIQSR